jgi:hypothetical protein
LQSTPKVFTARDFRVRMIYGSKTIKLLTAFTNKAEDLNANRMTVGERTQSVTKTVNHLYPIARSIQSCT